MSLTKQPNWGYSNPARQRLVRVGHLLSSVLPVAVGAFYDEHDGLSGQLARAALSGWMLGQFLSSALFANVFRVELEGDALNVHTSKGVDRVLVANLCNLRLVHCGRLLYFCVTTRTADSFCNHFGFTRYLPGERAILFAAVAHAHRTTGQVPTIGTPTSTWQDRWRSAIIVLGLAAALGLGTFVGPSIILRAVVFSFTAALVHVHVVGFPTTVSLIWKGSYWVRHDRTDMLSRSRVPRGLRQWASAIAAATTR